MISFRAGKPTNAYIPPLARSPKTETCDTAISPTSIPWLPVLEQLRQSRIGKSQPIGQTQIPKHWSISCCGIRIMGGHQITDSDLRYGRKLV